MTHRFPIKEIARQAGLGTATVDRVLNDRPNVSRQTRNRVIAALDELESQEQQLAARGKQLFVDIVVEAPKRFSNEIRKAAEAALVGFSSGVLRPRFIFQEKMSDDEIVEILKRIASRGSHGVCLKARDTPPVRTWVDNLEAASTPVMTLVTDIPQTRRSAYVGLDNENAGRTAAYLLARTLPNGAGSILATRSNEAFYGEMERYTRFCETLASERPDLRIVDVSVGAGLQWETVDRLDSALKQIADLAAVYSMGGGNAAILKALRAHRHVAPVFIAHDLDKENRKLIRDGDLSFILHHDLAADMRNVFLAISNHHGSATSNQRRFISDIQIVTPFNIPGE